jgi:tRNA threonylcarbamoyl adenosine modification protein YjeE
MNKDSQGLGLTIVLGNLAATAALGEQIAAGLTRGAAVALKGDLGAGKTTLARAILRALGVRESVPSPTFTLVQTYETKRFPVHHYDFYRIENEREIEQLGLDDALAEGAALIEWPERAGALLPGNTLHVALAIVSGNERRATLSGSADWAAHIGRTLADDR